MGVTDRDRKLLWAKAHNRCAHCRVKLVVGSDGQSGDAVIGEEAHIIGSSRQGPRGSHQLDIPIDAYDNLILLCPTCHRMVDKQVGSWPVDALQALKRRHEAWAEEQLDEPAAGGPVRVVAGAWPRLRLLYTGTDVWHVMASSHAYYLEGPDDADAPHDHVDQIDTFLQDARDWAEISTEVTLEGPAAVRRVTRALQKQIEELSDLGYLVFGAVRNDKATGGVSPADRWRTAILMVVKSDDPRVQAS